MKFDLENGNVILWAIMLRSVSTLQIDNLLSRVCITLLSVSSIIPANDLNAAF